MTINLKNVQDAVQVDTMQTGAGIATPFEFVSVTVQSDWLDYNGHMNECMYLFVASMGYEGFAKYVGLTPAWAEKHGSYFTAENHNVYILECREGDVLTVKTHLVDADEKRLHLCHMVYRGDDVVFTSESMNLYVNPVSRRVERAHPDIMARVQAILSVHKKIENAYAGRTIGIRRK